MKRIHIAGCGPRTGTTLMAELMGACFDIDASCEHEESVFALPDGPARVFLTKRPADILVVEPLLQRMDVLHVVYLLRDPRDTIASKHGRDPDRYWASLRYWRAYAPVGRALAAHPRFITVRFEELVARPDEVQELLALRLPFLSVRARFSEFHGIARPSEQAARALGGLRAVDAGTVGSWRQHLPRVAGQIRLHGSIAEDLIEYGYEADAGWLDLLEGVEPDLARSHWPEYFSRRELWSRRLGRRWKARLCVARARRRGLLN